MADGKRKRRLNLLLLGLTLAGGFLWGFLGEAYLDAAGAWDGVPASGLYFTLLFALSILACLVSESAVSSLVSRPFFAQYTLPHLKACLPLALAGLFGLGCLLQFWYSLDYSPGEITGTLTPSTPPPAPPDAGRERGEPGRSGGPDEIDDYYFIVDDSSSMGMTGSHGGTDPDKKRIALLARVVEALPPDKRAMLVKFADQAELMVPLDYCTLETKRRFREAAETFNAGGFTDIVGAVRAAAAELDPLRRGAALLITDGDAPDSGLEASIQPYIAARIPIYSILLGYPEAPPILERLSLPTGGRVVAADNFEDFEREALQTLRLDSETARRLEAGGSPGGSAGSAEAPLTRTRSAGEWRRVRRLLAPRVDRKAGSLGYALMRIGMIGLTGLAMGLGTAPVFNRRGLFVPLAAEGIITGILAGVLLETGLQNYPASGALIRTLHDALLAALVWTAARRPKDRSSGGQYGETPGAGGADGADSAGAHTIASKASEEGDAAHRIE
jgi:Ca-activated chloride channel family protein